MASVESGIARHYDVSGLEQHILAVLADTGVDIAHLRAGDLEAVDEFHIGGIAAPRELLGQMGLKPGARLLDDSTFFWIGNSCRHVVVSPGFCTPMTLVIIHKF